LSGYRLHDTCIGILGLRKRYGVERLSGSTTVQRRFVCDANQHRTAARPAKDRAYPAFAPGAGVHQSRSMPRADHDAASRPKAPQIWWAIARRISAQAGRKPGNLICRYGHRPQPCGRRGGKHGAHRCLGYGAHVQACRNGDTCELLKKPAGANPASSYQSPSGGAS